MPNQREELPPVSEQDNQDTDQQEQDLYLINHLLVDTLLMIYRCSPKIRQSYAVTAAAIKLQICPPIN
jgi:hypothetical protein